MMSELSSSEKKIIRLSVLGTCLEIYDFTLFSVFAIQIGKTFFTNSDPLVSTLSALGAFAAGFVMRPIGGLAIGMIGDKIGRKKALSFSIFLMAIPPLVVSFLPSYEKIGLLAPLIILFLRLIQGFSAGGEFNGAAIYILENLKNSKKAFYSSFVSAAGGMGALLAILLALILNLDFMPDYAFRFAFLIGASIGLVGFFMRSSLPNETYEETDSETTSFSSLKELFKNHKRSIFTTISVGALDGTLSYSLVGFIGVYVAQFLGVKLVHSFAITLASLSLYLVLTPLMGKLCDKLGAKKFYRLYFLFVLFLIPSIYKLIQTKELMFILLGQCLMALCVSGFAGTQHAYIQSLFPKKLRYTGVAFSYNLGTCLLGGTSPMILTALYAKTKNLDTPIYYVLVLSLVAASFILRGFKKII